MERFVQSAAAKPKHVCSLEALCPSGTHYDSLRIAHAGSVSLIDSILKETGRSLGLQLQMPEFAPTPRAQREALEGALQKLVAAASDNQMSSIAAAITWEVRNNSQDITECHVAVMRKT